MAYLIVWIILWIIIGLAISSDAKKRGMSGEGWFFIILLLGPLGILLYIAIKEPILNNGKNDNELYKDEKSKYTDDKKSLYSVSTDIKKSLYHLIDFNLSSPIEVVSAEIKVGKDGKSYISAKFFNCTKRKVNSLKLRIYCYDSFGEPVNGENNFFEKTLQDLKGTPKGIFGGEKLIDLGDFADARRVKIIIDKILFRSGLSQELSNDKLSNFEIPQMKLEDLKILKEYAGEDAICLPADKKEYWLCVCGRPNEISSSSCMRCDRQHDKVMAEYPSIDVLKEKKAKENEEKAKKEEEERKRLKELEEDRRRQAEIERKNDMVK